MTSSPTVCVAEVRYGSLSKKIAIYERMSPSECSVLMQAAFFAPSAPEWSRKVVGFVHLKTKTFLPLSLGTAFPQLFQPNHTYELILEKKHATTEVPKPKATPAAVASVRETHQVQPAEVQESWGDQLYGLLVHWDSHNTPGLPLEKIEALISQQHPQLRQAYLTYQQTHDLEALVQQIRRVLAVLMQQTKSSFTRVVNQLPLLKTHDIALIHELFTQGNELVLAAWEVYELEEDKEELADTLLRIVRFKRQQAAPSLESICREMVERNLLSWSQYQGLLQLWEAKNEAMVGAVEAFHVDKDMKELVDTLLLVVKHAGLAAAPSSSSGVVIPRSPEPKNESGRPSLEELHPLSPKSRQHTAAPLSPPLPSYGTFNTLTSPSSASFLPRLLEALHAKSLLNKAQYQVLSKLAEQNDSRLETVTNEYKETRDAKAFVQHVVDLCDVVHWEKNHTTILHKWIIPLEKDGLGDGLRQLWKQDDPRLMAAYLLFVHDNQEGDFIDTLKRLSVLVTSQASEEEESKADFANTDEQHENTNQIDGEDADRSEREIASSLLAMHSAGKISQDLLDSLQPTDPKVAAAFDVFESSQDMDDLVDTLERIGANKEEINTKERSFPPPSPKPDEMEKQLLHFVYELQLPEDEVNALKQAIATNDVVVQAAIEVFQVERDEEDLKDTLRRVARYNAGANEAVDSS